jgi:hypothetical protein
MGNNLILLVLILLLLLALLVLLKQSTHKWSIDGWHTNAKPLCPVVNHFHSRTTIKGSAPTLGMPQQTTTSMFGQGCTHSAPSFTKPNPGSAPYTFGYNGRAYPKPNSSYKAPYTTVAYTDPIPLPGSLLGFLPNYAYQNTPRFNACGHAEASGFGYETPTQFLFRPQRLT